MVTAPDTPPSPRLDQFAYDSPPRPKDVGILAVEMYFPKRCVSEAELEAFDSVSQGKYTIGLGQEYMAFVDDREDINSFALTAVSNLLEKYDIDPKSIGRLEVGTETIIDKSKSVKTVLMDLFTASGNMDIEGIDSKNACYGSTAAVFNCINWIESNSWDGRNAIIFAGDIAIYREGNARAVGGAGGCAMLIGPNAPIVFEPVHGTFMANIYDFYKPDLDSEYPSVDGPLSTSAYIMSLDYAYTRYREKLSKRQLLNNISSLSLSSQTSSSNSSTDSKPFSLDDVDYPIFHCPYGKLVQKGHARLVYNDYLSSPESELFSTVPSSFASLEYKASLADKSLEKAFVALSQSSYDSCVRPSLHCSRRCGNMYTGSLYAGLASLISFISPEELLNKRLSMFAYGGGSAASFFTILVKGDTSEIRETMDLRARLESMTNASCQEFADALALREKYHSSAPHKPIGSIDNVWPGSYYLESVDEQRRRKYSRTPLSI